MNTDKGRAAAGFGERLRALMQAKGRVSDKSRSGVDVAALADAAGSSYEMARRYAEGLAMPRPETMHQIAAWLDVAPAVLAWGAESDSNSINTEVLQQCITAIIQAQAKMGTKADPETIARLASVLYLEAMDGRAPAQATVIRMLRAMI